MPFLIPATHLRTPSRRPDADSGVPRATNADLRLVFPLRLQRRRVNSHGKLAFFLQIGIGLYVVIRRVHVLHAGHAQGCRVFQCADGCGAHPVRRGHGRHDLEDQVLSRGAGSTPVGLPC